MNKTSAGSRKPFRRLLLTGAGGNLGRQLRDALAAWADIVRVSDIVPVSAAAAHEEASVVDLADHDTVMHMVEAVTPMWAARSFLPWSAASRTPRESTCSSSG